MGTADGSVVGITKIFDSGPPTARWNLVIVAEGYQAGELARFQTDANEARDALLAESPFDEPEITCGINVYRLEVTSDESGADKPACSDGGGDGTTKRTYFDATFCADGETQRLLSGDGELVESTVGSHLPQWHQILVIVNDPERGGAGGTVGWTSNSSADWRDVFIHELGHSAFGLADEYDYDDGDAFAGPEPDEPNVSKVSDPASVKWSAQVTAGADDPTMDNSDCTTVNNDASPVATGIVGTFEGAQYWHCGLYRPRYACMMRETDDDFCPVCKKVIRDEMAQFTVPAPGGDVSLASPNVDFNDVVEGLSVIRAGKFLVSSCMPVTFELTVPPTAPFSAESPSVLVASPSGSTPWDAYFWFRFDCDGLGAAAPQNVTIRCLETGEDFVLNLTANCIARPSVAAELVFDQSGSMLDQTDEGRTKEKVLQDAAGIFVDLLYDENGIGINAYDQDPHDVMPIAVAGAAGSMGGRDTAISEIAAFAANPAGMTAIGDGVEQAKTKLDGATGYDEKAMVVLTDGKETAAKYLADVAEGVIGQRAFAIGLGTPELIEPGALSTLTAGTGGYLLMTGNLGVDETFLLEKYYLQILAGVNNNEIVLDPEGIVLPGEIERIPFDVSASDAEITAIIVARPAHVLRAALEAPDGTTVAATNPSIEASRTTRSLFLRAGLPLMGDSGAVHEGRWQLLLGLAPRYEKGLSHVANYVRKDRPTHDIRGVSYTASVHAFSNLRMQAGVAQTSRQPGSELAVHCQLTEYGAPFSGSATARAELVRPNGSVTTLQLDQVPGEPGSFETSMVAGQTGVYRFRIRASGRTSDELPFTREQIRTAATWHSAGQPDPSSNGPGSDLAVDWCSLLACFLDRGGIAGGARERLHEYGIDLDLLRRCLRETCRDDAPLS